MSKFCGKCGAQLNDDATFCTNCGANLEQPNQQVNSNQQFNADAVKNAAVAAQAKVSQGYDAAKNTVTTAVKTGDKKTLAIVGGIGVVIIVLIVLLLTLIFGGGYKTPLNKIAKAMEDGNGKAYRQATMSSKYYKAMKEDDDDFDDDLNDDAKYMQKSLKYKYGSNLKVKFKVTDKEKLDEDDLEDYQDKLERRADRNDIDYEPKVTDGYELDVDVTIKGKKDKDENSSTVNVYKVDGDWIVEGY